MSSADFGTDRWRPEAETERRQVREQLNKLLARHSGWVSSPGESHPEALSDPYVTLSRHTAPIKLRTCFLVTEDSRPGLNPQVHPIAG